MRGERKRPRIYSRRGDLGETSLFSGPRVGKDQMRIVVIGDLDELSALLGLARAEGLREKIADVILSVQQKIVAVSTEIASLTPTKHAVEMIQQTDIDALEHSIDESDSELAPLEGFLFFGEDRAAAVLNLARTVCRRAERHLVALIRRDETVSRRLLAWTNRLSDLLFTLARLQQKE